MNGLTLCFKRDFIGNLILNKLGIHVMHLYVYKVNFSYEKSSAIYHKMHFKNLQ